MNPDSFYNELLSEEPDYPIIKKYLKSLSTEEKLNILNTHVPLDSLGLFPLYYAINIDHIGLVRLFLESGASIRNNQSEIPYLTLSYSVEISKILLEYGADLDEEYRGRTALEMACKDSNISLCFLYLLRGASHENLKVLLNDRDFEELNEALIKRHEIFFRDLIHLYNF